jgi:hypothetical protein
VARTFLFQFHGTGFALERLIVAMALLIKILICWTLNLARRGYPYLNVAKKKLLRMSDNAALIDVSLMNW